MRTAVIVALLFVFSLTRAQERPKETPPPKIEVAGEKKAEEARKPKEGSIVLMTGGEWERTVDEDGQVYLSRGYKGVVPGVRDEPPNKPKESGVPALLWVGFQPFPSYSRVFLRLEGDVSFSVVKSDSKTIEVRLSGVQVATPNDQRHLVTREFPTAIDSIFVEAKARETIVRIVLKAPTAYLYRLEGQYLFVDVSL